VALVEARAVAKAYRTGALGFGPRGARVLDGVTFSVEQGEVLALHGPNGSGKTTLLRLIAGLVLPDAGSIRIDGHQAGSPAARCLVGFAAGEERSLYHRLTARQNLEFFAALVDSAPAEFALRVQYLTDQLDLGQWLDQRVDRCSSGTRARIGLARSLLGQPRIWLLDEPTKSLDPEHAGAVRQLIRHEVERGVAVVMATHALQDAREIGARRAALAGGHVLLDLPESGGAP
jgi:ABC-2 type transport system ATP-binding protein